MNRDKIEVVLEAIRSEWHIRNQSQIQELEGIDTRISELRNDAVSTMDKMRAVNSKTAIQFLEDDLIRIEGQIEELQALKSKKETQMPADFDKIMARVKYFLEHLDELLIKQIDPVKKAKLFAAIFNKTPTYEELKIGTQKTPLFTGVNPFFQLLKDEKSLMVTPAGVEPAIFRMRT